MALETLLSELVLPFLLSVATASVPLLLTYVGKKYVSRLDAEKQVIVNNALSELVVQGVSYAEQLAENYRKKVGDKMSSDDKLSNAVLYISNELRRTGLENVAVDVIRDKVEAVLGVEALEKNAFAVDGEVLDDEDDD